MRQTHLSENEEEETMTNTLLHGQDKPKTNLNCYLPEQNIPIIKPNQT